MVTKKARRQEGSRRYHQMQHSVGIEYLSAVRDPGYWDRIYREHLGPTQRDVICQRLLLLDEEDAKKSYHIAELMLQISPVCRNMQSLTLRT
jgi:hypothetical protein